MASEKRFDSDSQDEVRKYASRIESFLVEKKTPYSERKLLADLFGIKDVEDSGLPASESELRELSLVRNALKLLQNEKKVIGILIEDPSTKQEVMHYSVGGWYETP